MSIKHQSILDQIETNFKTIKIANGYHTDLGNNVFVNKPNKIISAADTEAINIVDTSAAVQTALSGNTPAGYFDYYLMIEATLHFKSGTASNDIRKGLWDVISRIWKDVTWSGLAINTLPPINSDFFQLVFDQDEEIIVGAKIAFLVLFRTEKGKEN